MKRYAVLLIGLSFVSYATGASAGQRPQANPSDGFFGFFPTYQVNHQGDDGYCYTDESCKAPHAGFDPHGNGVHPPIGAQTDQ